MVAQKIEVSCDWAPEERKRLSAIIVAERVKLENTASPDGLRLGHLKFFVENAPVTFLEANRSRFSDFIE